MRSFTKAVSTLLATSFAVVACSQTSNSAEVTATHIPVSSAKRQALGNCWLYAAMSWLESNLMVETNGREYNFSESYMLYRIYEMRLMKSIYENQPFPESIYSGGEWHEIVDLINEYGVMLEKDFIPSEANNPTSETQAHAEAYINESLANGTLRHDHSADAVQRELRNAFGVNPNEFGRHIISADSIEFGGRTLRKALTEWHEHKIEFTAPRGSARPQRAKLTAQGERVMIAIKDHLNQHRPLLANWWIDFNGVDNTGTASTKNYRTAGAGGAHMTNLVDYIASGVDPQSGHPFVTDEGEVSDGLKELAVRYGTIDALIMRNTWGEKRDDRPDYRTQDEQQRHKGGFQRLNADYLYSWLPISRENSEKNFGLQDITGIYSIVIPDYGLSAAAQDAISKVR
jgi:hypothetical protein